MMRAEILYTTEKIRNSLLKIEEFQRRKIIKGDRNGKEKRKDE